MKRFFSSRKRSEKHTGQVTATAVHAHTGCTLLCKSGKTKNEPKASHVGRQRATRQQKAEFTLNCWIQAAKINSKVKLILGLRKSAVPTRVPGPEQALDKRLLDSEVSGWKGERWGAGVNQSRGNHIHPRGWDCGASGTGQSNWVDPVMSL